MTIIDNAFALDVDRRLREKREKQAEIDAAPVIVHRMRVCVARKLADPGDERHVGFVAARSTHRTEKGHRK